MIGGSGIVDETFERRQYERMYGGKGKGNRTEEARERSSGRRDAEAVVPEIRRLFWL